MSEMLRVYVAGAYSAPNIVSALDNMRRGMQLSHQVLKAGFSPFVPWFDFLFSFIGETTIEEYYAYSIAWLYASDCMLLVSGWENSTGTKREIEIAKEIGLPIFDSLDDLVSWGNSHERKS